MSKVKIELNRENVRNLLRGQEMQAACKKLADDIAGKAEGSYSVDVHVGKNRCNASISTTDQHTFRDNQKNNTLLKAIGGEK